jgi:hypothetical protein
MPESKLNSYRFVIGKYFYALMLYEYNVWLMLPNASEEHAASSCGVDG